MGPLDKRHHDYEPIMAAPDPIEVAWAAAFFDGEGCTSVQRQQGGRYQYLNLSISQGDIRPLQRFRLAVCEKRTVIYPKARGPLSRSTEPFYEIKIGALDVVIGILGRMWPYLCAPKREQAREQAIRVGVRFPVEFDDPPPEAPSALWNFIMEGGEPPDG